MSTQVVAGPQCSVDHAEKKRRHIWPCVYHFYQDPPVIVRGAGAHLFDRDGQEYLDCYSGVGVMNAGHANEQILAAATEQMRQLGHTTTIYLTEPMLELAERLARLLPGDLETSFFCASGSEANEAALLLASLATGREEFVTFECGLHGRTKAAMSATALPMWRTDPSPLDSFHHAPHPSRAGCLAAVEQRLAKGTTAAVMLEPIQGNGGIHVPPDGFLPDLQAICRRHGTLLILDEVQTGINRTGHWLAAEGFGVTPDIVTLAKALGNGFPIAAAVTSSKLADAYRRPGASTYGGNPVCAAAALAVIDFHEQQGLGARAAELGAWLIAQLRGRIGQHAAVREIRGRGLMIGVELTKDEAGSEDRVGLLLESLKNAGYLLGRTGVDRNVLTIMPPLIVRQSELLGLVEALEELLDQ
jgi:acetylornithine/succinyldiaminopimelate/putrescine aminotransferase